MCSQLSSTFKSRESTRWERMATKSILPPQGGSKGMNRGVFGWVPDSSLASKATLSWGPSPTVPRPNAVPVPSVLHQSQKSASWGWIQAHGAVGSSQTQSTHALSYLLPKEIPWSSASCRVPSLQRQPVVICPLCSPHAQPVLPPWVSLGTSQQGTTDKSSHLWKPEESKSRPPCNDIFSNWSHAGDSKLIAWGKVLGVLCVLVLIATKRRSGVTGSNYCSNFFLHPTSSQNVKC